MLGLAAQPAEKGAHQKPGVEPVGLGAPMLARHRNAGRMDHIGLDPPSPQNPRQPEAVAAGLEGHRHPLDPPAALDGLAPPSVQERRQRFPVRGRSLQRLTRQPGNKAGHKPALQAQFDDRNQRAILVEGDEGPAQIVHLHGALHLLPESDDGATPSSPPHRIFSRREKVLPAIGLKRPRHHFMRAAPAAPRRRIKSSVQSTRSARTPLTVRTLPVSIER